MKKRTLTSVTALLVALTTTSTIFAASGASGVVEFGDNSSRTHFNTINDQYPWMQEAFLPTFELNGKNYSLAGNSTAIGAGNVMVYPVSAPNDDPNGQGYLTFWDMTSWSKASANNYYQPKLIKAIPIKGVSNSSPVYDPTSSSSGDVYLAAGGAVYKFTISGTTVTPAGSVSISSSNPTYRNQVVSYPMLLKASQTGLPKDSLWVSSQNGNLYAIDPTTMKSIGHFPLGSRLDASPSLVTSLDKHKFITVTSAYSDNNTKPSGTLFVVNPLSGIVRSLTNHFTGVPSVSSPVSLGSGGIVWNDIEGDVLVAHVNNDGSAYYTLSDAKINTGETANNSEGGFNPTAHEYILPFTDGKGGEGIVDFQTGKAWDVGFSGLTTPDGSPEISSVGNLYTSDAYGGLDRLMPAADSKYEYGSGQNLQDVFPIPGTNLKTNQPDLYIPAFNGAESSSLTTPSELSVGSIMAKDEPTLTLATNNGLELWVNTGEYLLFGSDYTSAKPTEFTQPLTLTVSKGDLPSSSNPSAGNLVSLPPADKISFSISVNGGAPQDTGYSTPTYNGQNPVTSVTLSTTQLNTWLKNYEASHSGVWSKAKQNKVVIEASLNSNSRFAYEFVGSTVSNKSATAADVTVKFNPVYVPPKASTASSKSTNSDLVVPQWMMAKYFPNIVSSVPSSDHSQFNLSLPAQTYMNPHLYPSGMINFSLISPSKSSFPSWLYNSQAKLMNDTTDKEVSLSHLSNSFNEEGDALAVKANDSVVSTQLAKWLSGNQLPYKVVGSTDKGTVDSHPSVDKNVNLQYNINSERQFTYSETRWFNTKNGTVYYTWSGPATESDTPSKYDVKVQFDHYVAKPSVTPTTYSSQKDTKSNGFAWFSNQTNGFNVDPSVPMFYNSPEGAPHLAYAAGQRMREVKPVVYNTMKFENVSIKPHSQGASVATSQKARSLLSRLGSGTSSGVVYKGASITNSMQVNSGQLVARSYVLDVGNSEAKKAWGDSAYSAQAISNDFLKNAGGTDSGGKWSMPVNLQGKLKIGSQFYGKDTGTKTLPQASTSEKDYTLTVSGGQLVAVNGSTDLKKLPSDIQTALSKMNISTGSNIFNTFENAQGSKLTDGTLASIGNKVTQSNDYKTGTGWYNEGTKTLVLREYTTKFNLPSWQFSDRVPMTLPTLSEPVDKTQLFTRGLQGFIDYEISVKNGSYMDFNSGDSKPYGGKHETTFTVPNATIMDSYQ